MVRRLEETLVWCAKPEADLMYAIMDHCGIGVLGLFAFWYFGDWTLVPALVLFILRLYILFIRPVAVRLYIRAASTIVARGTLSDLLGFTAPYLGHALALANRQVRSPLYALPKTSRPFFLLLAKEPLTHQARLVALRWVERRADPRLLLELLHEIRMRRAPCLDLLLRLRRPEHRRRSPHWTCTTRSKAGVSGQRGACRPIGRGWPTLRAA